MIIERLNVKSNIATGNGKLRLLIPFKKSEYSARGTLRWSGLDINSPIEKEFNEQYGFKFNIGKTSFWDLFKVEIKDLYC